MKIRKFRKRYWVTILGLILMYILFVHGPLFAWSPIKPGYTAAPAGSYTLYTFEGVMIPAYPTLDSYIVETSRTFDLPLKNHITIIRTDRERMKRYLPWLNTDAIGGAALQTGDVLYINAEKIAEQGLSEEEYIKHEVVHLLHHQNTDIVNAFNASKRTYLSEGVPFYVGGPVFYSREEFLGRLKKAKLEETTEGDAIYVPDAFDAMDEESADRYKISHMLYGEFIGYLIRTYGQEKFNAFNHAFLKNPMEHRELFEEHFGKTLEVVLQEFEETLL